MFQKKTAQTIAFPKDSQALVSEVNKIIEQMRKNGEIKQLLEKYCAAKVVMLMIAVLRSLRFALSKRDSHYYRSSFCLCDPRNFIRRYSSFNSSI